MLIEPSCYCVKIAKPIAKISRNIKNETFGELCIIQIENMIFENISSFYS